MALRDTLPRIKASDESYYVYYDFPEKLYVILYGCDDCYYNMEKAQGKLDSDHTFLYDDALNYTDGFVMQSLIEFDVPDMSHAFKHAWIFAMCIENTTRSNIKSCYGIEWKKPETYVSDGYFENGYLTTRSWLIPGDIPITLAPSDSPNLADTAMVDSPFPALFGDWVVRVPTVDGSKTTVVAYRHQPRLEWERPLWTDDNLANDVRFEANDVCKVYTYN